MKSFRLGILLVSTMLLFSTQCDEDDLPISSFCDSIVIIDESFYENAESSPYISVSAVVEDNCLLANISASGCDGSTWSLELVDSGGVLESLPIQRNLKFVLTNNEACLAVITREQSFDLTSLQVEGESEIILNIEDLPEPILYTY